MFSKNIQKRLQKKMKRHNLILAKETGAVCTDSPTKFLALCNVGQINGLNEQKILEAFSTFGALDKILLVPGKSCCFIAFKRQESAVLAFDSCNGKLDIAQDNKPVFLAYVEQLPIINGLKTWNELPPGLLVLENFVTEAEELELIRFSNFDQDSPGMRHRQVKHFGYEFRYDVNNIRKDEPLDVGVPEICNFLWSRLYNEKLIRFQPDQLTINYYKPGQGIPPHVDTHSAFESPIISLSLSSSVIMEFKKDRTLCVVLPRRSLAIIGGESRYDWTHGIIPRKYDCISTENGFDCFERGIRISFTFRKILKGECHCSFKSNCDSHLRTNNDIKSDMASKLESIHVHEVYEDIAGHFSETRHKPWPRVLEFVQKFEPGAILVDVGCGNGKYLGQNPNIYQLGTDRSFKLSELCRDRNFEVFTGDCLNVPLKDCCADGALSIAVIHHLSTEV